MEDRSRISRCFCLFYFFLTLIAADTIESSHMKWIKLCKKLKASAWRIASWLNISEFLVLFVLFLFTPITAGKIDSSHMRRIELYKKPQSCCVEDRSFKNFRFFFCLFYFFLTLVATDTIDSSHMKRIKLCKKLKVATWRIVTWLNISEFLFVFCFISFKHSCRLILNTGGKWESVVGNLGWN